MRHIRAAATAMILGLGLAASTPSWALAYNVVEIAAPEGNTGSTGLGLNERGDVVGSHGLPPTNFRTGAFFNIDGQAGIPGGWVNTSSDAEAVSINDARQVLWVNRSFDYNGPNSTLYDTLSQTVTPLAGYARAINEKGQVVGTRYNPGLTQWRAYVYDDGAYTVIPDLAGGLGQSAGLDINEHGVVVGVSRVVDEGSASDVSRAFVYANGTSTDIGTLGGRDSWAVAVNDAGVVLGTSTVAGGQFWRAFTYKDGVITDLGAPEGAEMVEAVDINNDGWVLATVRTTDQQYVGYVYADGQWLSLDGLIDPALGWRIGRLGAINDKGQIVVTATKDGWTGQTLLLTPTTAVPEPDAGLLMAVGVVALAWRRRTTGARAAG